MRELTGSPELSDVRAIVIGMGGSDRAVLELAGRRYRGAGRHQQAMRDELDLSETAFWQRVNRIVDAPSAELALELGPLINRLRRQREAGIRQRTARRAG